MVPLLPRRTGGKRKRGKSGSRPTKSRTPTNRKEEKNKQRFPWLGGGGLPLSGKEKENGRKKERDSVTAGSTPGGFHLRKSQIKNRNEKRLKGGVKYSGSPREKEDSSRNQCGGDQKNGGQRGEVNRKRGRFKGGGETHRGEPRKGNNQSRGKGKTPSRGGG